MKCDLCNNTAVVHEVTVKAGVQKEVHLCEEHAREAGVTVPHAPLDQLLTQFVQTGRAARKAKKTCEDCGMTFAQFRQSGSLGCPRCYETFDEQLSPLIERAHNGASHHQGKAPRRAGASTDRQALLQRLLKELDQAVTTEQYERAANLRDRLRGLREGADDLPQTTGGDPPDEEA